MMTKRRDFLKKSATATLALSAPMALQASNAAFLSTIKTFRPSRLRKGDTIGLVAPGFAITDEMLQKSIAAVEHMGLKPYFTERPKGRFGYFSNTDTERAKDLMEMFTNPKVNGIFCIRGGYGCTRILDLLDFSLIAKNPKVVLGYSDITALINAFYEKLGLVGFHGAMGPEPESYAYRCLADMVMYPNRKSILKSFEFDEKAMENPVYQRYTINPGKASGILAGGNLSLLAAMTGTNYDIDYTGRIVCIEDIGEAPYRIDRMLTQLLSTPTFKKAAGIVFGICADCDKKPDSDSFTLKEVIMDRIAPMGIPAIYGMSFGHLKENLTFPIGIEATLDTSEFTLQLSEKPVD